MNKINKALEFLIRYGQFDGSHHKAWVIDQTVRILAGGKYAAVIKQAKAGEDGPDTYGWDVGTPP